MPVAGKRPLFTRKALTAPRSLQRHEVTPGRSLFIRAREGATDEPHERPGNTEDIFSPAVCRILFVCGSCQPREIGYNFRYRREATTQQHRLRRQQLIANTGMSDKLEIRESVRADAAAIESLYPQAFPDEDLLPLVRDLLQDPAIAISLVAVIDSQVVGHAIFTKCGVAGRSAKAALLGPLAVAPAWQRRGIGSAIVRAGMERLKDTGVTLVCVLGDPAYYGRLGFVQETRVEPPFPLPAEWSGAWQSQHLDHTDVFCTGKLAVPPAWRQPALWAP